MGSDFWWETKFGKEFQEKETKVDCLMELELFV